MSLPGSKLNGGFLRDSQDRVVVSAGPIAYEQGGVPVDSDGAIVISPDTDIVWRHVPLTQAAYDALAVKDPQTFYYIIG